MRMTSGSCPPALRRWQGQYLTSLVNFVRMLSFAPRYIFVISQCLFSLRVLTVYGNPISALPEALLSHAAQAGWCGASVPLPALTVESGLAIHVSAPS